MNTAAEQEPRARLAIRKDLHEAMKKTCQNRGVKIQHAADEAAALWLRQNTNTPRKAK